MEPQVPSNPARNPFGYPSVDVVGDVTSVRFFVSGPPHPKGRPRGRVVNPKGGKPFVSFYTDEATVKWESWVEHQVTVQLLRMDIEIPFTGRLLVNLRFNLEKPKSTPASVEYPVKNRTDVDNLAKAVLDALQNAHLIANDSLITDLSVSKRYADDAHPVGVEIDVTCLP